MREDGAVYKIREGKQKMEEMKRLYVSLLALRRTRVENETGEH